jgi:tetratricopeptide (TPR) repeat protein/8-oxo-dGTP pyrophosphatase MutT (NUDIX family)
VNDLRAEIVRNLNFAGLAITAQALPDGSLLPVEGVFDKLLAAAREKSFPRLNTVIVAYEQPLAAFGLAPIAGRLNLLRDPYADFHVIRAHTLAEAVTWLAVDAQTRWGNIDCALSALEPSFVGRTQLLAEVRRFVATHESGYLVLVGGIGQGKSAFIAELVRNVVARGEEPIYHLIDYQPSASARPCSIAACLYSRLQRKYAFPEPRDWEQLNIEDKLERLLKHLSETELQDRPEPEVLYLDAADQAEVSAGSRLLPGALRSLPRGVLCIITSRSRLDWLGSARSVTLWEMSDHVDDRADVRAYLQQQSSFLSPPLDTAVIDRIIDQPDPPVFFTVVQRLRQLADSARSSTPLRELCADPGWWIVPPEQLIQAEAVSMVDRAEVLGLTQTQVWRTLGVLAVAREGLSEAQLSALQIWEKGTTDRILNLAANFFAPRPLLRQPQLPRRFDHSGYHQAVLDHLSSGERADCHHQLAAGCMRWQELDGDARHYILRHGLHHLLEAHQWDELDRLLGDIRFVEARYAAGLVFEVAADVAAAAQRQRPLAGFSAALIELLQRQATEHFRMQLRSAFIQVFGSYANWPETLRAALEQSEDFAVLRFVADTHDMEGQHVQAAQMFERIYWLTKSVDAEAHAEACVRLANVYEHLQQYREALHLLDELVARPDAESAYPSNYWWAHYHRGVMLHRLGEYAAAQTVLETVRQASVDDELRLASLHHLGIIDLERGHLEQSEVKFRQCMLERDASPWNHRRAFEYRRLGQIYARTDRFDEAQTAFNEAITISKQCGNHRYVRQTHEDIAALLIPSVLRRERPSLISLPGLARRFNVDEAHLIHSFHLLHEAHEGYLEVVDADTAQPTGQIVRWEAAHRDGWWHASVSVVVVDGQGQVVWQQRGETDSRGKWDISVAGHQIVGESDVSTAARETAEELGISINPERFTRIGTAGEFSKIGMPSFPIDRHDSATSYRYRTDKTNRERVSVFALRISDREKAQITLEKKGNTLGVKWRPLADAAGELQIDPGIFASAFKQVFGHSTILERIRTTINLLPAP